MLPRRATPFVVLALLCACSEHPPAPGADAGADPSDAGSADRPLCVDGRSVDGAYPQAAAYGFTLGDTIPNLSFPGPDSPPVALADAFEPCASRSRILALRLGAGWCATCRWSAQHLTDGLDAETTARIEWLDVLLRNDDNASPSASDAADWRERVRPPGRVAVDPAFVLAPFVANHAPLPIDVFIDTRTMKILFASTELSPEFIVNRLRQELAKLDGLPRPASQFEEVFDGTFDRAQWALLHEMTLPVAPPADPTNAFADDPKAASLGEALFSDTRLSPTNTVSCATCHDATREFADRRATSVAAGTGDRNAPSALFASHARWQFWDGRADTLWAQATGPLENPAEFASSRLFVAHAVAGAHRAAYEEVFGALPPLEDGARFPANGKPGEPSYDAMAPGDREAVTRVLANIGKAIAAFERRLRAKPNRLDAYLGGQLDALTSAEKAGAVTFFTAGCVQCHSGPRLTDDAFHNVRFPTGRQDSLADRGRALGIPALLASPFRADGPFSDAPGSRSHEQLATSLAAEGAFRTPPLRGVRSTAPYGHGGTFATLREVVENYSDAGLPITDPRAAGAIDPWLPRFSKGHVDELVRFLEVLEAEPAPE